MYGVTFGSKHSYDDYRLVMTGYDTGNPAPRRYLTSVPGRNGILDLTEILTPNVKYENRPIQFTFVWKSHPSTYEDELQEIRNDIHGKRMQVTLDSDPDWYYDAYLTVESSDLIDREKATIVIAGPAAPYKYAKQATSYVLNGNGTLICENDRMEVIPQITNTAETEVVFGSVSVTLSPGTHRVDDIVFTKGNNTLVITSTGQTTITYRQGRL